jgi:hypothetical protein
MSIEDPRPGDRFRVTFEGTYRGAPGRLHVGESAGLPWGFTEHAVSVERIGPEIVPGALYVDADGRGWEASRHHLHPVPTSQAGLVRFDQAHTLPGLRRARLVPDEDA